MDTYYTAVKPLLPNNAKVRGPHAGRRTGLGRAAVAYN